MQKIETVQQKINKHIIPYCRRDVVKMYKRNNITVTEYTKLQRLTLSDNDIHLIVLAATKELLVFMIKSYADRYMIKHSDYHVAEYHSLQFLNNLITRL